MIGTHSASLSPRRPIRDASVSCRLPNIFAIGLLMVVEMMTLIDVCCFIPNLLTFFGVERAGGKTKPFMIKSEKEKSDQSFKHDNKYMIMIE